MTTYITDSGSGSTENVNLNTKFQFLAFWAPSASFHIFFRLCTGDGDMSKLVGEGILFQHKVPLTFTFIDILI